jgi:hypothetical protein
MADNYDTLFFILDIESIKIEYIEKDVIVKGIDWCVFVVRDLASWYTEQRLGHRTLSGLMARCTSVKPAKKERTNGGEPGTRHVREVNNSEDVVEDTDMFVPSESCELATSTSKAAQGYVDANESESAGEIT